MKKTILATLACLCVGLSPAEAGTPKRVALRVAKYGVVLPVKYGALIVAVPTTVAFAVAAGAHYVVDAALQDDLLADQQAAAKKKEEAVK